MRLALVAVTVLALATYGLLAGKFPTTKAALADSQRIVSLYADGQTRLIPTDATTVGDLLNRAHITLGKGDLVEPELSAPIPPGTFYINVYRSRPVVVLDGTREIHGYSAYQNPALILGQLEVKVYPEDIISTSPVTDLIGSGVVGEEIDIKRAKLVNLSDFLGNERSFRTQDGTVGAVLVAQKISLKPGDKVEPSQSTVLTDGIKISLTRINEEIVKEEESIPFSVQAIRDPNLEVPNNVVEQEGSNGTKQTTYRVTYRNGKVVSKEVLKTEVTTQPVTKITAKGGLITANTWSKLAWCESRGNPADNTGNGYYGAYQFSHSSWGGYGGYNNASDAPLSVQTEKAAAMQAVSGWRPWPTCASGW